MRLWSDSWANGERIPPAFAAGRPIGVDGVNGVDGAGGVTFSDNRNPHLAWSEVPAGTRSFALICHDFDVPSRADDVNQPGREVPAELPRVDFFHWVMIDLPAGISEIAEGELSQGFTPRGKPAQLPGRFALTGARHGLNDYTGWFANDPDRAGDYFGYDGPFPPWNDSLVHHYVFTLYALDVARAPLSGAFTGAVVRREIYPHVLGEATHSGTYTLNPRLLG